MSNYYEKFETGKIIVALNKNANYVNVLNEIDYEKVEVIFHSKKRGSDIGDVILVHLKNKNKLAVINTIEKLSANPNVVYAEPDFLFDNHIIPNDPYYRYLWGMEKIKAPLAWNYTTGSPDIVVGVVDSGVDYNHPDIRDNMWVSQNGQYINGWNFINNNSNSMDTTGHGTHVAGTIGAVGNNFIGITGLCWTIQIASLRIGHILFDLAAAIAAIDFANINNIPILNNSWGTGYHSFILKFAIEQYNGLFIVSAGNHGVDIDLFPDYPASYDSDNIISVAATDPDDTLASYSNYGAESVDIAAPGTDIFSLSLHDHYSHQRGTSMAAPHVAGAAALLKSNMPELTASDIKSIILSSAYKLPNLDGKILTGGILDVNAMFERA